MLTDKQSTPIGSSREVAASSNPSLSGDRTTGGEYVPKLQQNAEKLRNVAQQVEAFLMPNRTFATRIGTSGNVGGPK